MMHHLDTEGTEFASALVKIQSSCESILAEMPQKSWGWKNKKTKQTKDKKLGKKILHPPISEHYTHINIQKQKCKLSYLGSLELH